MRKTVLALLLMAGPVFGQVNSTADVEAILTPQFTAQWTNGGVSGIRQAMRDWPPGLGANDHPGFVGRADRYPQCIFRDALHEQPLIVWGQAMPANGLLPNRDDKADDRAMDCKAIFKVTNAATAADYVNASSLSLAVRFVTHEYLLPTQINGVTIAEADRIGWWAELSYIWTAVDDGVPDGRRCRTAGEGQLSQADAPAWWPGTEPEWDAIKLQQNWHDCGV